MVGLLPQVPGVLIVWLAVLVYALQDKFSAPGPIMFGIITVVGLVGATADMWMKFLGARVGGASGWALLAGGLLGLVGMIVFFPLGGIIGMVLGVILVEWYRSRSLRAALLSGGGTLGGYLLTTVVELILGVLVIVLFALSVLQPLSF